MNRLLALVLGCSFATIPGSICAEDGAVAATANARAVYEELAEAVVSEPRMLSQVGPLANAAIAALYAKETGMIEMEASYPGLRKVLLATIQPLMAESVRGTLPPYRKELSELYAASLSRQEAAESVDFFRSAAAIRFYDSAAENMTYASVVQQLVGQQDATTAAIETDLGHAATRVARTVTPADRQELTRFFTSPAGRKLTALKEKKLPIDTKWLNYSPPGLEERTERAMVEAMVNHVAKTDPDTARAMRKELLAPTAGHSQSN